MLSFHVNLCIQTGGRPDRQTDGQTTGQIMAIGDAQYVSWLSHTSTNTTSAQPGIQLTTIRS